MKRALFVLLLIVVCACDEQQPPYSHVGSATRGKVLIDRYGCPACHVVPGVSVQGMVGPPLDHMAARGYIAGRYPNVPQHMIRWLRTPELLKPHTAMPNLGVTDRDARDIAAYLYTLR